MQMPRVTVIIPAYNRARYLGEAIRSVLEQTFRDFELLVVDDGSTDQTAELIGSISDPRVRYLPQSHRGISPSLNAGLRAARGECVARLDSDDCWLPDMLESLVAVLDSRSDIGVAYGRGQVMDHEGRWLSHSFGTPERFRGDSLRSLVYDDCTCNIALLARRACFDRAGLYDETLPANEDWDMWLRVARHYRFAFVDKVLACIRWHDDNLTGLTSPQLAVVLETRTMPLDKLFSDPQLPAAIRAMHPIAYTNVYLFRSQRWLQKRNFRMAGEELRRAMRVSHQPLTTGVRMAWLAVAVPVLRRHSLGQRALTALSNWRRHRHGGSHPTRPPGG